MFGEILKNERKTKQLSQEELAEKLNMTKSAICNYERGIRKPNNDTLMQIAKFFDVSVDYLLGLDNVDCAPNTLNYSGDNDEEKNEITNIVNQILNNINDESKLQQIKMFLETYIEK